MKKQLTKRLEDILKEARENNIKIAVASDEEGNGYNIIGSSKELPTMFSDTRDDVIVIGVDYGIECEDLFK
jgi:hypothetical protein